MTSQITQPTVKTTRTATADVAGDPRFQGGPAGYDIVSWATDILGGLGIKPTPTRISMLVTWANHESGGYGSHSSGGLNNPLNTTLSHAGNVTAISQGGAQGDIQNFGSPLDGVKVQVDNLLHSSPQFGYGGIVSALQAQNPDQFFAAIDHSSFGTHFGSGTALQTGTGGSPSGAGGTAATETSVGSDIAGGIAGGIGDAIAGPFGGLFGGIPGVGGAFGKAFDAATLPGKLAGVFLGLFTNWRYVAEVGAGLTLILLGILLILHDTGADRKAAQAAGVVAVAA